MGARQSLNNSQGKPSEVSPSELCKRQRSSSSFCEDSPRLISSLPDEITMQILARIPRINHLNMKLVSRAWKAAILSAELFNLRKELGTTEEWLYILTKVENDKLLWYALDPLCRRWQRLPPMPNFAFEDESRKGMIPLWMWNMVGPRIQIADVIRGWLGKKDKFDRMRLCGCAIGVVDGCLYVLGGFSRTSAMKCVWRYDPILNTWSEATDMSIGRAYCKTGILNNKLYVVGGLTRGPGGSTPLQSAEVFDPQTGTWSQIPSMPFQKAQSLPTALLADLLKPIATGITSYKGRLFVPQSLYCWPFFVDVGGEVYDPEMNSWVEMPMGMGEGWPAKQAGTKLSVTVDGELYALDPSSSPDSAKIKVYDSQNDAWKISAEDVPIPNFIASDSPYLLASLLGKLHVITKDANHNIAIWQADLKNHITPSPSASSSSHKALSGNSEITAETERDLWEVISTCSIGLAELVSCQTLNV